MDRIILKNMKFYGYHGVLKEEREQGQDFFIDVEIYKDLKKEGQTDDLCDAIDYSKIYDIIKNVAKNNKFQLIEALAHSISREILLEYREILEVVVRVRKPGAPIHGELDWPEVEVKRKRDEF